MSTSEQRPKYPEHEIKLEDVPERPGRCNAWNPKAGKRCGNGAGKGTDHYGHGRCYIHGGNTVSHRKAAMKAMAADEALRLGLPVEIDPRDALLLAVHAAAGLVAFFAGKVAETGEDRLVWGVTREERRDGVRDGDDFSGTVTVRESKPNVWYVLYREARHDLVNAAAAAARAGVEQRQVEIAERHAQAFADAVRGILSDLGVDDHPDAPKVVRRWLLAAGAKSAA